MYKIIGKYRGKKEVIDEANTYDDAVCLANEYYIAYGSEWSISILEDEK